MFVVPAGDRDRLVLTTDGVHSSLEPGRLHEAHLPLCNRPWGGGTPTHRGGEDPSGVGYTGARRTLGVGRGVGVDVLGDILVAHVGGVVRR